MATPIRLPLSARQAEALAQLLDEFTVGHQERWRLKYRPEDPIW